MISDQKIRARREVVRPDAARWQPLVGASSSSLCDGQGRRGALDAGIRPVTANVAFTGPALTIECRPGDNLAALRGLDWIRPGDVVVLANGASAQSAIVGGNYVALIKARGAVALVADGPARDLDELDQIGLPVFSRGVMPGGPFKTGPGSIGFPVTIGAVTIASGDVIVGDRDGVVAVRQEELERAVAGYQAVRDREAAMAEAIGGGGIPQFLREKIDAIEVAYEQQ